MFRTLILVLAWACVLHAQSTEETQFDTATTATNCGTCNSTICSTASIDSPRSMNEGATAGSSSASETHPSATNDVMIAYFEDSDGLGKSCSTGTATTRLNVTTAGSFTVTEICVCQGTTDLGAATGLSISLASTGVKTQTVSITGTASCATNPIRVVYCGNVGGSHGNQSYSFTPNQNHTIPTPAPTIGGREGLFGNPITY